MKKTPLICDFANQSTSSSQYNFVTRSVEESDPDETILKSDTFLTKAVESSDPDEMHLNSTQVTEETKIMTRPLHHDMGVTYKTYTIEDSDPDELHYNAAYV